MHSEYSLKDHSQVCSMLCPMIICIKFCFIFKTVNSNARDEKIKGAKRVNLQRGIFIMRFVKVHVESGNAEHHFVECYHFHKQGSPLFADIKHFHVCIQCRH